MTSARSLIFVSAFVALLVAAQVKAAPFGADSTESTSGASDGRGSTFVAEADRDKPLGVGDQVTLEIVEDKGQPVARRITDTGELDVPYIGRIRASGKTSTELAAEIKRKLEADYYYTATVRLGIDLVNRAAAMGRVFVSGDVKAPGSQEFNKSEG